MKFQTFCWLLVLAPFLGLSQGKKALPSFTSFQKKKTDTAILQLSGLSGKNKLALSLSAEDSALYLTISGSGWGTATIDNGDRLMLLFTNDSVITVKSTGLQSIQPNNLLNTYAHQYALSGNDLAALSQFELTGIRKYSFGDFSDLDVPLQNAERLKQLSRSFLLALDNAETSQPARQIDAKDIRRFLGTNVSFCAKVEIIKNETEKGERAVLLELQSTHAGLPVVALIPAADLLHFNGNPEKKYSDKEVCVSGVPVVRNNIIYLTLRDANQIKTTRPIPLNELAQFVGDSISVNGTMTMAQNAEEAANHTTIFYVQAPFQPEQGRLLLSIDNKDRKNFDKPEQAYHQKTATITGKLVLEKGQYHIRLQKSSQVEILAEEKELPATLIPKAEEKREPVYIPPHQTKVAEEKQEPGQTAARFPGGEAAFDQYLQQNLLHPEPLKKAEQHQVVVFFEIDAWGVLQTIRIEKSAGAVYDEEVRRALRRMPKWTPAMQNGLRFPSVIKRRITFEYRRP